MLRTFINNLRSPKVIIVFFAVTLGCFLVDWLTKHYLFDNWAKAGDYKIIGVTTLPHDNSTVFSAFNVSMPVAVRILINFFLIISFTTPAFFTRSVLLGVGLGVLMGGVLGNSLDIIPARPYQWWQDNKVYTHYVRDIFYLPWLNKGIFNAGDFFVLAGAGIIFIRAVIELFEGRKENKATKKKSITKETKATKENKANPTIQENKKTST